MCDQRMACVSGLAHIFVLRSEQQLSLCACGERLLHTTEPPEASSPGGHVTCVQVMCDLRAAHCRSTLVSWTMQLSACAGH